MTFSYNSLRRSKLSPKHVLVTQLRCLSLHEYQSQTMLKEVGVPVPRGRLVRTVDEVQSAVKQLGPRCAIKAQVLDGGLLQGQFKSGLEGGIHNIDETHRAVAVASKMLGSVYSDQTLRRQIGVKELYVQERKTSKNMWYLAMTIDRDNYRPAIVVSKMGGMDVKEIATKHPDKLFTFGFSLSEGITPDLIASVSKQLDLSETESRYLESILHKLYKIFSRREATSLELNPLSQSDSQEFTVLGSRFQFDNSAADRQRETFALRDFEQQVSDEVEAEKSGLLYVRLEGNIGNVVNGAGLAMATNDAIGFCGGSSANFLDAGGKATKDTMQKAFGIITRDERVKAILVNIYGGLTRCDMIAESIISAADELDIRVPVVVRLQGTNSEKGLKMLEEAKLGLHVESDLGKAAQLVVDLAKGSREEAEHTPNVARISIP